jgi:hypothetical protein
MIYDVRSSEVWWNADNKQKEREAIMEWTGRSEEWKAVNRESSDLMICAAHFMASQLKSGRRIPGQMPHNYPIPVGHDLSTPLPDVRPPRTEEVKAARRAEAGAASESRRQKALAQAAVRADREEELRKAVLAQDMEARLGQEVDWVAAEITRLHDHEQHASKASGARQPCTRTAPRHLSRSSMSSTTGTLCLGTRAT